MMFSPKSAHDSWYCITVCVCVCACHFMSICLWFFCRANRLHNSPSSWIFVTPWFPGRSGISCVPLYSVHSSQFSSTLHTWAVSMTSYIIHQLSGLVVCPWSETTNTSPGVVCLYNLLTMSSHLNTISSYQSAYSLSYWCWLDVCLFYVASFFED